MVKVLIVAGAMNIGGIENQLMHLLRQANKEQFKIDFTTTDEHPYYQDEMLALGALCIQIPKTEGIHFFRYCRSLYRVMCDGEYDVVHTHELFHSGMVLLTARIAGVKHRFVHAHNWMEGNDPKTKKCMKRRVYNYVMQRLIQWNATDFIACSTMAGKFLFGEKVTKQSNYHLVYNSVDTSRFIEKYDQMESGEFCDDGWVNILQVGRFTPVKNQLFTAEIAKELKARGKKIRILCAGNESGDYERKVYEKIKENGLEEYMILLGIRSDVDVLMRKASAFLLPSLYEGMPLVLIEAQAAGLISVVADTFSHEVDFGINTVVWMKLEQSVFDWADALESAIKRGRVNKESVTKAIEIQGFDSKVFGRKICDLYSNAMKRDI